MKHPILNIIVAILFFSCSNQQARKPVSYTKNNFIKESIERNKKMIASEEKLIDDVIKKDTLKQYLASSKGYWYKYDTKIEDNLPLPQRGDVAYFDYEIKTLLNKIIYTKEELKSQQYYVDKENILMGLRDGIKLMKQGETVTFLFPSHMAFGYHGDDKKIGANTPIICTVTLNEIKKETTQSN